MWVVATALLGFFLLWRLLSYSLLERAPLLISVSYFLLQINFVLCLILQFVFIAVMLVGALIFVLGIDLVKEALWDTRHRVSRCVLTNYSGTCFCIDASPFDRSEYITIVSIMICMTAWDFVIGVLFGIVVSCKHCSRIQKEDGILMGVLILKVSSSWFKTLNCEVYVPYIRAMRPCQLYADQVCNGRIYGKSPSKRPYYVCMVSRKSPTEFCCMLIFFHN